MVQQAQAPANSASVKDVAFVATYLGPTRVCRGSVRVFMISVCRVAMRKMCVQEAGSGA